MPNRRPILWWTTELARVLDEVAERHPAIKGTLPSVKGNRIYLEVHDDEGPRLLTLEVTDG